MCTGGHKYTHFRRSGFRARWKPWTQAVVRNDWSHQRGHGYCTVLNGADRLSAFYSGPNPANTRPKSPRVLVTPMSFLRRRPLLVLATLALLGLGLVVVVPQLRWRAQVLALYLSGKIPDIELGELLAFMAPGSDQTMTRLIETRNPHAVVRNYRTSAEDIAAGATRFQAECSRCHGPQGSGGPGAPALVGRTFTHGAGDWAIYRTIRLGVPNTGMASHPYSRTELWQLVAYLRSIDRPDSTALAAAADIDRKELSVSPAELEAIKEPGADWLMYSGSYTSARHSGLRQVTPANVNQLGLRWIFQYDDLPSKVETSPIVRHGILFLTVPPARVIALNAATGKRIWRRSTPRPALPPRASMGRHCIVAWPYGTTGCTSAPAMRTSSPVKFPPDVKCGTSRLPPIPAGIS